MKTYSATKEEIDTEFLKRQIEIPEEFEQLNEIDYEKTIVSVFVL